jgi:hypothetical protein
LGKGNAGAVSGYVPDPLVATIITRNAGANFPAERVQVHFEADSAFTKTRQIHGDGVEIEPLHQTNRPNHEAAFLPRGCAAEI